MGNVDQSVIWFSVRDSVMGYACRLCQGDGEWAEVLVPFGITDREVIADQMISECSTQYAHHMNVVHFVFDTDDERVWVMDRDTVQDNAQRN